MATTQTRSRGRPRLESVEKQGTTIQALDRGINLLCILSKEGKATLTELALRIGMPPSSAHRILSTLQKKSFVEFHETTQEWMIGVEAFRVGNSFVQANKLVAIGIEVMQSLVEETGETSNLAIANDGLVVVLNQVETRYPIRALFPAGTCVHMHASSVGKALLAGLRRRDVELILQTKGLPEFTPKTLTSPDMLFSDLEKTRKRGWALDDEEHHFGMRCIAAPIFNAGGEAIAGISISGPTVRMHDERLPELATKVKNAAIEVTNLTGGTQPKSGYNLL